MSEGKAYVGSKISLISKSEIRYEGILYTIDPKEATVALAKVRSFGTEDRFTDKPIASRDDVYEYVIFRGKDIKDIKVCEPPQPQALIGGLPNDPAIVEAYQSNESRKQSFSPTGSFQSDYVGVSFGVQPYSTHGGSRSGTPTQKRKSPTMDQGIQVSGTIGAGDKRDTRRSAQSQQIQRPLQPSNQQRQGAPAGSTQRQQQPNRGWVRRGGRGQRGGAGGSGSGGGGGGSNRVGFNKPKEQLKFDGEYDFEQANAEFKEMESKFAKTKITDTVQNGTIPTVTTDDKKEDSITTETTVADVEDDAQTTYYDKTKSFFDSISCEALERSKGKFQRTDWRQERKLNVETFGVSNSYMRRGGFRGRGYRGRGGYRGGRSRGGRGGGNQGNPFGQNSNRGLDSDRSNSQSRKPTTQGWDTAEA